ncbi:MAG TPA: hypothetical protein PLE19_22480 [Planctomycetota bacterium]|nr:hypothetical protein [Planctomycetota bacterium]HRR82686.1 hypothetical protein [Planctomycetota bacterium]HRT93925.1 hypothetical protein [Planctomycetota bacterium]
MRPRILALIAVCVAVAFVASVAMAAEGEKPKKQPGCVGTVAVTKDGDAIKSITITGGKKDAPVVYCVVLDENGKKVAAFDGKKVKAIGTIAEKDGNKWITVTECTEIVPKPKNN